MDCWSCLLTTELTHFAYNISTNTVYDQCGIALITYDEKWQDIIENYQYYKHKAIANFILSLNYNFSLRLFHERIGSASNIAHITNWTDNESGLWLKFIFLWNPKK